MSDVVEVRLAGPDDLPAVHALGFSERLGHVAFGERYLEAGIEPVSMRKVL